MIVVPLLLHDDEYVNNISKFSARLAQSAERKALNLVVVGSSPTVGGFFRKQYSHGATASAHVNEVESGAGGVGRAYHPDS